MPRRACHHCLVVTDFELQFAPEHIDGLASGFTYADDSAPRSVGVAARARGHYTRDEFLVVCAWKTVRSRTKVEANDNARVERATASAFATGDESRRMEALITLDGVGVPTASALLHFAFPGEYPILDMRALESLGHRARTQYSVSFWLTYLRACRQLARDHQNARQGVVAALQGTWRKATQLREGGLPAG